MTDARTLPGCCQGCADTNFNREFSSTRAPSLHELREEGLDTVSMPNERTCRKMLIPQRMGPAGSIKSDQETIPRRVRLPATEPRQLLRTRTWCCCSSSPHFRSPISAACFVESTTSVKRIVAKVRSGSAPDESRLRSNAIETNCRMCSVPTTFATTASFAGDGPGFSP